MSAPPPTRRRRTLRASLVSLALVLVGGLVVLLGTTPATAEEGTPGPVVVAAPGAPIISVEDLSARSATLTVTASTLGGETTSLSYVFRNSDNSFISEGEIASGEPLTFGALSPDTDYTFVATAWDEGTAESQSTVRTLSLPPNPPYIGFPDGPILPTAITVPVSPGTFDPTHGDLGGPVDFIVVDAITGGSVVGSRELPGTGGEVTFDNLTPETAYEIRATAIGPGGTGENSLFFSTAAEPTPEPTPTTTTEPTPTPTPTETPEPTPTPTETTEPTPEPEPTTTTEPTPQPTGTADPGTLPETDGDASTVPPAESSLTDGTRGSVTVPEETAPGSSVVVTVGGSYAGQSVNGWLFSTPTSLGSATVSAEGTVTFTIPSSVPVGAHRLALTASDGSLIGWDNITVAKASATTETLAETGGEILPPLAVATALLLAGASLMLVRVLRGERPLRRETFVKQE